MPRKRYTDEQIGFALRQAEAGVEEICRTLEVAETRGRAKPYSHLVSNV